MRLYYQDRYCTIYHGDCLEVMDGIEPVDLVLTDPPYGIGESRKNNVSRGVLAAAKDYGRDSWDNATCPAAVLKAISMGKKSIVFGGNYYELPPSACWIVWDKENGANDFADCELAWTNFPTAVRIFRYRWQGMIQGNMKDKETRRHPTQKPLPVMLWCLSKYSSEGHTILDPFMGSGTTLRAAKDLERRAIGIEIEEKYCEIAARRLSQGVLPFGGGLE